MEERDDTLVHCPFCRLVRGDKALHTSGTVAAFNDGSPVTDGHRLIVPLRHVGDVFSMTRAEVADSLRLIRHLVDAIKQDDPTVTGFNIGMNIGASAGQTVFHAHIHLIPRRDGDTPDPRGGVRGVIAGRRGY